MFVNQKNWLESCVSPSIDALLQSPSDGMVKLINQEFIVNKLWPIDGYKTANNRRVFRDVWKPGSTGIVAYVLFNSYDGWSVNVEYEGPIAFEFLEPEEVLVDIPIAYFLDCTQPKYAPGGSHQFFVSKTEFDDHAR